jgi:predicted NUDIX family phosphoesterase/thymidylate kinase
MSVSTEERAKNILELEELAAHIIKLKKSVIPRRPIVIEFCGSPKAGKTSCINSLAMFLRRNNIRTIVFSERGAVCPIRNKFDPSFNIWAGCSGLVQFSEIVANHSKYYDVVIMDRGFFDAISWFHWQKKLRKLHEKHYKTFVDFFLAPKWISKLSVLYIFKANPQTSLKREHANLLTTKHGTIMNPEVLADFNAAIDECEALYRPFFGSKIRKIDTSSKNQEEVGYQVTKDILETLNEMIVEKIGYFDRRFLDHIKTDAFDPIEIFGQIRKLHYGDRQQIEEDISALQPIPVAVITDMEQKKIIVAKKLRSATSARSAERGKGLVYFGGHIREEDEWTEYGNSNIADVAGAALARELKEELDIDYDPSGDKPVLCIWDRDGEKSSKHIALVYHVKIDRQSLRFATDRQEFAEKGVKIADVFKVVSRLDSFESWSKVIMDRLIVDRVGKPLLAASRD